MPAAARRVRGQFAFSRRLAVLPLCAGRGAPAGPAAAPGVGQGTQSLQLAPRGALVTGLGSSAGRSYLNRIGVGALANGLEELMAVRRRNPGPVIALRGGHVRSASW